MRNYNGSETTMIFKNPTEHITRCITFETRGERHTHTHKAQKKKKKGKKKKEKTKKEKTKQKDEKVSFSCKSTMLQLASREGPTLQTRDP